MAVLSGAASVTASSYGSWIADTQQDDPAGAFDGNPATAWAEGNEQTPVGQWLQIGFSGPLNLPSHVGIRLLDDSTVREIASVLRVSTAAGTAVTDVAATGAVQPLNVPPGRTGWLRITIAAAQRVTLGYPGAGISDVLVPGVKVTRLLQPAQDPAGQQAPATAFSFSQPVPSPFAFADPAATPPMARTFTTAAPAALRLQASALALPGPGLDAMLDSLIRPPGPGLLQVTVASTPGAQPARFPASLISGTAAMPWTADTASPVIHLAWPDKRRITSLIVRPAAGLPSTPLTVQITSPDGTRQASIGPGGLVTFSPLTTDRIDVSFPRVRQATIVTSTGQLETLPVRLSQLSVPALAGLRPVLPDQQAPVTLACGQGPALTIDGRAYPTSVTGTVGALTGYLPLQVRLCAPGGTPNLGPGGTLTLAPGRHTLTAATPGTFAITDLSLATTAAPATTAAAPTSAAASTTAAAPASAAASTTAAAPASAAARAVTIRSWQPDQQQLTIGPGAASYLEIHENDNPGWAATLNGRQLTPVRLDGWQQAFIVPAGAGGPVTLTFRPAATYHLVLIASILAVALLLALAAWSFLTPRRRTARPPDAEPMDVALYPLFSVESGIHRLAGRSWPGILAIAALIFVAGGPLALAVAALACGACQAWPPLHAPNDPAVPKDPVALAPVAPVAPKAPTAPNDSATRLALLAAGAMVASGLLSAVRPFGQGLFGPFGWPAQACALVALAAALLPAVAVKIRRRPAAAKEDR